MKAGELARDMQKRGKGGGPRVSVPATGMVWVPMADQFLVVPAIPQVSFGNTSAQIPMTFSKKGRIVGWRGTTVGDGSAAGLASVGVRVNIGGEQEIVTDGTSGAYALFDTLFPRNGGFAPFSLDVDVNTKLYFMFNNRHTSNNYTPDLVLAFVKAKGGT